MNIDTAPRTGEQCDRDGCEGTYVKIDNNAVCNKCGHVRGTSGVEPDYRSQSLTSEWRAFERARDQYSGFRGPERVKLVGGFVSAYDFDEDF